MAGVWNVNGVYNGIVENMSSKVSFQIGEILLARIESLSEERDQALLKLMDGCKISAILSGKEDVPLNKTIRLKVEGYEDNKLIMKMVREQPSAEEPAGNEAVEAFSRGIQGASGEKDKQILSSMIKHNIPLTEENISNVKTQVDLLAKLCDQPMEQEKFIDKFLAAKGISRNSEEGRFISTSLKEFFSAAGNLTEEDVMTMIENKIPLTKENVESFNRLFKDEGGIYKVLKEVESSIHQQTEQAAPQEGEQSAPQVQKSETETSKAAQGSLAEAGEAVSSEDVEQSRADAGSVKENSTQASEVKDGDRDAKPGVKVAVKQGAVENTEAVVKKQINSKMEEMKKIISGLIKGNDGDAAMELGDKILGMIKSNASDFKVFNSISSQYYYVDVPVSANEQQYDCKLIIKDERRKNRNIDSKDVKIAACVNTNNMGVVNAVISVNNNMMKVTIESEEPWVQVLDKGKEMLLTKLNTLDYNISIDIKKKLEDLTLGNCCDFFQDENAKQLNVRV